MSKPTKFLDISTMKDNPKPVTILDEDGSVIWNGTIDEFAENLRKSAKEWAKNV